MFFKLWYTVYLRKIHKIKENMSKPSVRSGRLPGWCHQLLLLVDCLFTYWYSNIEIIISVIIINIVILWIYLPTFNLLKFCHMKWHLYTTPAAAGCYDVTSRSPTEIIFTNEFHHLTDLFHCWHSIEGCRRARLETHQQIEQWKMYECLCSHTWYRVLFGS